MFKREMNNLTKKIFIYLIVMANIPLNSELTDSSIFQFKITISEMSDGLDRLYTKFFGGKQIEHHPVIDLILIRTSSNYLCKISEDSDEYKCFSKLPLIDSSQIQNLHNFLFQFDFFEAFENTSFKPLFSFSSSDLSELLLIRKKPNAILSDHYVVCVFFYWLMFILQSRSDPQQLTINSLLLFMDVIDSFKQLAQVYLKIRAYLFARFVDNFASSPKFKFNKDSIDTLLYHIKNDSFLGSDFSSPFLLFLQKVFECPKIDPNELLDLLNEIILNNHQRVIIVKNDFKKLSFILSKLITQLNIKAITALSSLSNEAKLLELDFRFEDNFVLLPPLLLAELQKDGKPFLDNSNRNQIFTTFENVYSIKNFEEFLRNHDESFKYSGDNMDSDINDNADIKIYNHQNPYLFDNGFSPMKMEDFIPLIELISKNHRDFFLQFSNALGKAETSCIDNFFMAAGKLFDSLESNAYFLDFYIIQIYLATRCVEKISLSPLFNLFYRKSIFYPQETIFHNQNKTITSIRSHVLNLFAYKIDQLIPNFLNSDTQYPYLFVEELSIVLNNNYINFNVFITKGFVSSFLTIMDFLIDDYFTTSDDAHKELVFLALHTVMYFLFTRLLCDHSTMMQLFNSRTFVKFFLNLSFINILRPFVFVALEDYLLHLNPYKIIATSEHSTRGISKEHNDLNIEINSISIISSYFANIFKKLSNFKNKDKLVEISQCLISILASNLKIAVFFKNAMDSFLEIEPFNELLPLALQFLSIISQNVEDEKKCLTSKQLNLIVKIIFSIEKDQISEFTKLSLINLCAASTTLNSKALFLITRPTMVPLVFIIFGSNHEKLLEIFKIFNDICDFSYNNCIQCHKAELDLILLQYAYNFLIFQKSTVYFRGVNFSLSFTESDIFNLILPFVSKIFQFISNASLINYLLKTVLPFSSITDFNNQINIKVQIDFANYILNELLSIKMQKMKVNPVTFIGYDVPNFVIHDLQPSLFNKNFTFFCWIKVDQLVSMNFEPYAPLIRLSDQAGNTFSLFMNRGILYYKFNDHIEEICQKIPSNQWHFVGFVCQRSSQENSTIGLFSQQVMSFCEEVPALFFPFDDVVVNTSSSTALNDDLESNQNINATVTKPNMITMTIGGNDISNKQEIPALMGPFGLANQIFDEERLEYMEAIGPTVIDDIPCFLKTSRITGTIKIAEPHLIDSNNISLYNNSFENQFSTSEQTLPLLINIFRVIDNTNLELLLIILSIIKETFNLSVESQYQFQYFSIIRHYLIKSIRESPSCINMLQLYHAFYSLLEVIQVQETMNSLFDNLLVNVKLYSLCSPKVFEMIVYHWGHTLVFTYPSLFVRKNYFNELVNNYVNLFNENHFDERYDEASIKRIRNNFSKLLEESSKLGLTKENIEYFENFINVQTDNEENLYAFLSILQRNIVKIHNDSDYALTLHHFAENENENISRLAIISIHELSKPHWMKPMMALAVQLKDTAANTNLMEFLLDNIERYPGFIHLIITLSASISDKKEKIKIVERLNEVLTNSSDGLSENYKQQINNKFKDFVNDKFWFIWILLAAIQSSEEVRLNYLTLISLLLMNSNDIFTEINLIVNILQILECVGNSFDYYQIVLDLFVNINAITIGNSKFLTVPCFRALFFKFNDQFYSRDIIKLFEETKVFSFDMKKSENPISDILSLEPLLVQDFSDYCLNFGFTVDAGKSKIEGMLGNFLIQLIENDEPTLTKTTSILADFVQYTMTKNERTEEQNFEKMCEFSIHFPEIRKSFNKKYLNDILSNIREIKMLIKEIKQLVFIDFDTVKSSSMEILKKPGNISQISKSVKFADVQKFINNISIISDDLINHSNSSTMLKQEPRFCRQGCIAYCPMKLRVNYPTIDIHDLLGPDPIKDAIKAKFFEFGVERDVDLVLNSENLEIFERNTQILIASIALTSIDFILHKINNTIEFYTLHNGSYYFEFLSKEDYVTLHSSLTLMEQRFAESPEDILAGILSTNSSFLTNFEYFIYLNYFTGRSWHNLKKLPGLIHNNRPLPASKFFIPEIFDKEKISNVYSRRHKLEDMDTTLMLNLAKKLFKSYQPKPPFKLFNTPLKSMTVRDLNFDAKNIVDAGFLSTLSNRYNYIFIASKNKEIYFIELHEFGPKNLNSHIITLAEDFEVVKFKRNVLIIGKSKKKYQRFSVSSEPQTFDVEIDYPLITICGRYMFYVSNDCEIKRYPTSHQNNNQKIQTLTSTLSKITCITSSNSFNVVAFGTENCQVHIYSVNKENEKILNNIIKIRNSQEDLEPQKLIITNYWGFIIVEAQKHILVYTINGTLVGKLKLQCEIVTWCTTTNRRGEDFVIFYDEEYRIGIFEAAYPSKTISYIKGTHNIISLDYNTDLCCIMAFDKKNVSVSFFPFSID